MADIPRRELIRRSAERVRRKPEAMKVKPKSRPGRMAGRWARVGSCTLTAYDVDRDRLRRIIEEAIQAHADEVSEPGRKVHVQLTEKVLRD